LTVKPLFIGQPRSPSLANSGVQRLKDPFLTRHSTILGLFWGTTEYHDADEENYPSRQTTCAHWLLDVSPTQKKM
jgi:hypothetical protein